MKILYDHQIFEMQSFGGISRYFYELIYRVRRSKLYEFELALKYSNNHYLKEDIDFNKKIRSLKPYIDFLPNFNFRGKRLIYILIRKVRLINAQYGLNLELAKKKLKEGNFDIFHPTYYKDYFINYIKKKPFVLTIYDMTSEIYPEYFPKDNHISIMKRRLAQKASKIIAISNNTKKDIVRLFNIDPEKIKVIYLGSSIGKFNNFNSNKFNINSISKRYILFVGYRLKYKNFIFFINSVYKILNEDKELKVICVGGGSFTNEEKSLFKKYNISGQILNYHANDYLLNYLYRNALLFVFPSFYEGFGLPILEAFHCGCPVILTNSSSFPEVGGKAAMYFELGDSHSLFNAINKVIYDSDIREVMKKRGYNQLKKFSWDKNFEEISRVYESIL